MHAETMLSLGGIKSYHDQKACQKRKIYIHFFIATQKGLFSGISYCGEFLQIQFENKYCKANIVWLLRRHCISNLP